MKKSIIIVLFIAALIIVASAAVFASDIESDVVFEDDAFISDVFSAEFFENYDAAMKIAMELDDLLSQARRSESTYPDCYGGSYFDSDGNLVVLIVEDAIQSDEMEMFVGRNSGSITTRNVEFSRETLIYVFEAIGEVINDSQLRFGVDCIYLQNVLAVDLATSINRVVVHVFDMDHVDYFRRNVIDHPAVEFTLIEHMAMNEWLDMLFRDNSEDYISDSEIANDSNGTDFNFAEIEPFSTQALRPGFTVFRRSRNFPTQFLTQSIGFRASHGNRIGFVTTAHGNPNVQYGDVFLVRGNPDIHAGIVRAVSLETDSVFVELASGATMSRFPLAGTPAIGPGRVAGIREGASAIRFSEGGNSPVRADGIVVAERTLMGISTLPQRVPVARANFASAAGDSGGVVVTRISPGLYSIIGLVVAIGNDFPGQTVFSTIEDIISRLGANPIS